MDWQLNVARHLAQASDSLLQGNVSSATIALGTAIAYVLRAAGNGDDEAFSPADFAARSRSMMPSPRCG
jgi:hypothetical protein